ncbi:MAG TPA: glycosyltransferase family 2 protein [Nitrospira sp.]|nr:glycosyltransferase family 2 protein [Nitrospira sp.]
MKVSGFTFCRNAVKYDYPVVESIRSVLPICDEFIVNVGRCEDGTLDLIRSIGDPRVKIIESVWDESLRKDGLIYSQQTNIALARCTGDWALYMQADEVMHEDDLPVLLDSMRRHVGHGSVKGLLFRYLHFVADYWSINPWFYHKAVRVVRNNGEVESCGDAVGFHYKPTRQYLQSGPQEWLAPSGARIFHYGWVKDPKTMLAKVKEQVSFHHDRTPPPDQAKWFEAETFRYDDYAILKEFSGRHPGVMHPRIQASHRWALRRNRWLNWKFYREVARRGFRG